MNKIAGLVALLFVSAALPAAAQSITRGPQECASLQNLQVPGVAVSEISAEWIPAAPAPNPSAIARPAHCALRATLDRRQGVDGQPYGIGFGLALPGTWNGRFLFQGGGGFNGVLRYPTGAGDTARRAATPWIPPSCAISRRRSTSPIGPSIASRPSPR